MNGTLTNSGTITDAGWIEIGSNATATNSGELSIEQGGELSNSGALTNNGTLTDDGTLSNNSTKATLTNNGTLTVAENGELTNKGTLTNASDLIIENLDGVNNKRTLTNSGTVTVPKGSSDADVESLRITNTDTGSVQISSGSGDDGEKIDPEKGRPLTGEWSTDYSPLTVKAYVPENGELTMSDARTVGDENNPVVLLVEGTLYVNAPLTIADGSEARPAAS
jgi:hypothetical protein